MSIKFYTFVKSTIPDVIVIQIESIVRFSGFNIHDFYSLCRGEPAAHSCAPARPLCHVTTNQQPYLTLAPLRVETICEEPSLVIFHDILTSAEMTYMKSQVLRALEVATVVDRSVQSGDGKRVSNERTQSSGWLWDTVGQLRTDEMQLTFP